MTRLLVWSEALEAALGADRYPVFYLCLLAFYAALLAPFVLPRWVAAWRGK